MAKRNAFSAEVISFSVHGSGQDCRAKAVVKYPEGAITLKFSVHSDRAYARQGVGTVCLWSEEKWSEVHRIHGTQLKASKYKPDAATAGDFAEDIAELQRVALQVIATAENDFKWYARASKVVTK